MKSELIRRRNGPAAEATAWIEAALRNGSEDPLVLLASYQRRGSAGPAQTRQFFPLMEEAYRLAHPLHAELGDPKMAALASELAGEIYGLDVDRPEAGECSA